MRETKALVYAGSTVVLESIHRWPVRIFTADMVEEFVRNRMCGVSILKIKPI